MTSPLMSEMTAAQQSAYTRWKTAYDKYASTLRSFSPTEPNWPNKLALATEEMSRSLQMWRNVAPKVSRPSE